MSNNYPRMLYKVGGTSPEQVQEGVVGTKIVNDISEEDEAAEDGWHRTTIEAFDADKLQKSDDSEPAPEVKTRADLEKKATSLGLQFDGRISDKKLSALIAQKEAK